MSIFVKRIGYMDDKKNITTAGDKFFDQMKKAGIADDNFFKDIAKMFLEEGKESLNKLRNAIETKNKKNCTLFAHKLKSSFLMFDMLEAFQLANEIEMIEDDNFDNRIALIDKLEKNCSEIFELIRIKYD